MTEGTGDGIARVSYYSPRNNREDFIAQHGPPLTLVLAGTGGFFEYHD
jgi:hypothetical protein